jgi:hypothetical protein
MWRCRTEAHGAWSVCNQLFQSPWPFHWFWMTLGMSQFPCSVSLAWGWFLVRHEDWPKHSASPIVGQHHQWWTPTEIQKDNEDPPRARPRLGAGHWRHRHRSPMARKNAGLADDTWKNHCDILVWGLREASRAANPEVLAANWDCPACNWRRGVLP